MATREEEAQQFLSTISSYAYNNPSIDINDNFIYGNLVRTGVPGRGSSLLKPFFDNWISRFKSVPNVNVFVDPHWEYFCQFVNDKNTEPEEMVKMYIPMDAAHIEEGASQLFAFLAQNNIEHHSKIGSDIRNDDIVVRVDNPATAAFIENFVNNNKAIQDGLISRNPFSIQSGSVAYAMDGRLSYNQVVSSYISAYLNDLKSKGTLNTASTYGLNCFVVESYNNTFIAGNGIEKFIQDRKIQGSREEIIASLTNYMQVGELFIESFNPNSNFETIKKHSDKVCSKEYNEMLHKHFGNILDKQVSVQVEPEIEKRRREQEKQTLSDAVYDTYSKYGILHTQRALEQYITKGNVTGFTRDNQRRQAVMASVSAQRASELASNEIDGKLDVEGYISQVINQKYEEVKKGFLDDAIYETYAKYGEFQMVGALEKALDGKYESFTNNNNARTNLLSNVTPFEIASYMRETLKQNGIEGLDGKSLVGEYSKIRINEMRENTTKRAV